MNTISLVRSVFYFIFTDISYINIITYQFITHIPTITSQMLVQLRCNCLWFSINITTERERTSLMSQGCRGSHIHAHKHK